MRLVILMVLLALQAAAAQHHAGHEHRMHLSESGIVMNQNRNELPLGCDAISRDHEFTIHGGKAHAIGKPGLSFGMSQHEVRVEPCSRVTVTFVNDDEIRHQWMVHGLPKYLYPTGMFHIEAMGGQRQTGTFIVPAEDMSYLIHCDMAQHMEKGMRGQLVVGKGSGNLWGIAGISDAFIRHGYLPPGLLWFAAAAALFAFVIVLSMRAWRSGRSTG